MKTLCLVGQLIFSVFGAHSQTLSEDSSTTKIFLIEVIFPYNETECSFYTCIYNDSILSAEFVSKMDIGGKGLKSMLSKEESESYTRSWLKINDKLTTSNDRIPFQGNHTRYQLRVFEIVGEFKMLRTNIGEVFLDQSDRFADNEIIIPLSLRYVMVNMNVPEILLNELRYLNMDFKNSSYKSQIFHNCGVE